MKNADKLIVIIGAAILVAAAIGVWLYKPQPGNKEKEESEKRFSVEWMEMMDSTQPDNPDMEAKDYLPIPVIGGEDSPYYANVTIPHHNLKMVKFILKWEDDHTYYGLFGKGGWLFGKKGLDTLTFEVTSPDGTTETRESEGNGTLEIVFDNINPVPSVSEIKANDTNEALEKLRDYYNDRWMNERFKIKVSVAVGESLLSLRPFQRFFDNGNNFTIEVLYTYYVPIVKEKPPEESQSNPGGEQSGVKIFSLRERLHPLFEYPGFH